MEAYKYIARLRAFDHTTSKWELFNDLGVFKEYSDAADWLRGYVPNKEDLGYLVRDPDQSCQVKCEIVEYCYKDDSFDVIDKRIFLCGQEFFQREV